MLTVAAAGALSLGASSAEPTDTTTPRVLDTPTLSSAQEASTVTVAARAAVLAGRERVVSRDSRREARVDAAAWRLRAAAERQAKARNAALVRLAARAEQRAEHIARDAWQLPVAPGAYRLTARFGECSSLWSHCHTGLDFAAPSGTPIRAVARGTITEAAAAGAYGNRTIETLEDGTQIWYCHQDAVSVEPGDRVAAGEVIGSVGSTGNSTGPHLHFEVRPDDGSAAHVAAADQAGISSAEAGSGEPVDPFTALTRHDLRP